MPMLEFLLPDVGEGIDAAELLEWKAAVGDEVREDQPLADIETDKAIVTLPCPADGVLRDLRFEPGDTMPVGTVVAVIETGAAGTAPAAGDGNGAAAALAESDVPDRAPAAAAAAPAAPAPVGGPAARPLASPATRKRARDLGVDLRAVAGSGPQGRIRREDVEAAAGGGAWVAATPVPAPNEAPARSPITPAPAAAAPPGESRTVPLRGIRRTIAQRLTTAWQTIPHVIDYREVDATELMAVRETLRSHALRAGDEQLAKAMTITPFIVKAACRALAEHPYANASVDMEREEITFHGGYHIGIATSAPDGLMVPVVRDADRKSLREVALELVELSAAARERRLRPQQLRDATFTVNNFGGLGIWLGTPIINPPEVANLGIGRLDKRAVVRDDEIVIRSIVPLSMSGDHRILDGDTLAAFVSRIVELMEQPALLLEDAR